MRLVILLTLSLAVAHGTYLVTYPEPWSGGDFTLAVSLLSVNGSETQADVTLALTDGTRKELRGLQVGSCRQVTFTENELLAGNATGFNMVISGTAGGRPLFSTTVNVAAMVPRRAISFVQLERSFYEPGDEAHFNVFGVYPSMLPFTGPFRVAVSNPRGFLVKSWDEVRADSGVVSLTFPLPAQVDEGSWNVVAEAEGLQTSARFKVGKRAHTIDELTVEFPEPYYIDGNQNVSGTITARSRGQPVEGSARVTINSYMKNATKDIMISGPTVVNISGKDIQALFPDGFLLQDGGHFVNVSVVVNDSKTGRSIYGDSIINIVKHRVAINEVKFTRFTPGFRFLYDIMVSLQNGQPLTAQDRETKLTVNVSQANSFVFVSRRELPQEPPMSVTTEWNATIPSSGIVLVDVAVLSTTTVLEVSARYGDVSFHRTIWVDWKTLGSDAVQIRTSQRVATVGRAVFFNVETLNSTAKVLYQVVSQGRVVECGTVTNSRLSLTPTRAWGPVAHVFAYFGSNTGQLVHDMVSLPLQGFINKVDVSWEPRSARPGEVVDLLVNVRDPGSFVGVNAYPTDGSSSMDMEIAILSRLEPQEGKWMRVKFSAAGLGYRTDAVVAQSWEGEGMPQRVMVMPFNVLPTFSESWMWQTRDLGLNRRTRFLGTVSGTARRWQGYALSMSKTSGLGLGQTSDPLEVFVPVEVYVSAPSVAYLGEEFIVEVTVVNKQEQKEAKVVATLLEHAANFTVLFPTDGNVANQRALTLAAGGAGTAAFAVSLLVAGEVSFTVVVSYEHVNYTVTVHTVVKYVGFPQVYSHSVLLTLSPNTSAFYFLFVFPSNYVNASGYAVLYIYGNVMGPSLCGLETLLVMPYGCGEQTMINLAPGIYIRIYLELTLQITVSVRATSQDYMVSGYQRELTYMRTDGSFSAFGNSDAVGSTWLTAFVLRSFLQAQRYISVDPRVISDARGFLLRALTPSGEFVERGRVIHKSLQGGSAAPLSLTAYTLLAFLEDPTADRTTVASAVAFLEANVTGGGPAASLPLAITAYALTLANSSKAAAALALLSVRATNQDDLRFWEDRAPGQLATSWQPTAAAIEATAYVLLTHVRQGKIAEAVPIMKWLSQQRNHLGGYSSTQDTVVALQALSEYAALSLSLSSGSVTVSAPSLGLPRTVAIGGNNATERHVVQIPISPRMNVTLSATGSASIMAQLNVFYHTRDVGTPRGARAADPAGPGFTLDVQFKDDRANGSLGDQLLLTVCTSWTGGGDSGMALMDVDLLSGFAAAKDQIKLNENIKLVEESPGKLYLYLVDLTATPTCVDIPQLRVAIVAKARNGAVAISDYYEPRRRLQQEYSSAKLSQVTTCSLCGPDCGRCKSNVRGGAVAAAALTPTLLAVTLLAALGQAWLAL